MRLLRSMAGLLLAAAAAPALAGPACGPLDVVLVVDDTAGLDGEIASLATQFTGVIAPTLAAVSGNDYQLGLVTFKDTIQVDVDLGSVSVGAYQVALNALAASGGGNLPEASDEALKTVVNGLDQADRFDAGCGCFLQEGNFDGLFRPSATGIVILLTDALPGGFDDMFSAGVDDVNANAVAQEAALAGLRISAIGSTTNSAVIDILRDYAVATAGVLAQVPSTGSGTATAIASIIDACGTALVDLSLTKSVDNPAPLLNDQVTFTVTVTNNGPDDATAVIVGDLLPAALTYISDDALGAYVPGTGVWTAGDLTNGANASLAIVARKDAAGAILNVAEVCQADQADADSFACNDDGDQSEDDEDSVWLGAADLRLMMMVDNLTPALNDSVTFTVTVTNDGPEDATGVTVEDVLPAGLNHVSDNGAGAYVPGTGTWTIGALANGAGASLTITVAVAATGILSNAAQICAADLTDLDSTPCNDDGSHSEDDEDAATLSVPPVSDLRLEKTVNDPLPMLTDTVTFTVTVTNDGPDPATGVSVDDALPAGLSYVSDDGLGAYSPGTGAWTIGNLGNGTSTALILVASVDATGTLTNIAEVCSGDQDDPDSAPCNDDGDQSEDDEDAATVTVPPVADLRLTKTVDDATPFVNNTVTFTLTVTNDGPDDATGVIVADNLAAGLSHVADNGGGAYVPVTGIWTIGNLANGASTALDITVSVDATGTLTNIAQVCGADQADLDSSPCNDDGDQSEDDEATASLTATLAAQLIFADGFE